MKATNHIGSTARRGFRLFAAGVALGCVTALAGCGADRTYSIEEVKQAFRDQRYELVPPRDFPAPEYTFRPNGSAPFLVNVPTDAEAARAWPDLGLPSRPDRLDFRRGNVIVIATKNMALRHQVRVRAALDSLPDAGGDVTTLR